MKTKSRTLTTAQIINQVEELAECQNSSNKEAAQKLLFIHGRGKESSEWRNRCKYGESCYNQTSTEYFDSVNAPRKAYDFISVVACLIDTDISCWKQSDLDILANLAKE